MLFQETLAATLVPCSEYKKKKKNHHKPSTGVSNYTYAALIKPTESLNAH